MSTPPKPPVSPPPKQGADALGLVVDALWQSLRAQGLSFEDRRMVLHALVTKNETEP